MGNLYSSTYNNTYSCSSLFTVIMVCATVANPEFQTTEPLLLGDDGAGFLHASRSLTFLPTDQYVTWFHVYFC